MYSDKLQAIKAGYNASNGVTIGNGISHEGLERMIRGFCTADDAVNIKHKTLFDLFDEYCRENGYPIVNRHTLGRGFCSVLGLCRKKAKRDGALCWVYVKKVQDLW